MPDQPNPKVNELFTYAATRVIELELRLARTRAELEAAQRRNAEQALLLEQLRAVSPPTNVVPFAAPTPPVTEGGEPDASA